MPDDAQGGKNIKITEKAWEILREAKFRLHSASYSDTIRVMNEKLSIPQRQQRLQEKFKAHPPATSRFFKAKTPEDSGNPPTLRDKAKTVIIDDDAISILEQIKLDSKQPKQLFSYSDAIEFLFENMKIIEASNKPIKLDPALFNRR